MRVVECESPTEAANLVADEILSSVRAEPDLVLGLATGSTPVGIYQRLTAAVAAGGADLSQVRTFNLDEYVGLAPDHPQSYRTFMRRHLFDGAGIPDDNCRFPPTEGHDLASLCAAYEDEIRWAGGIDIQLLGIGSNGHIAFNEPTSSLASRTRVVTLTDKTLRDNARHYPDGETQPELAVTMGIGTILEAKRILLQSFGPRKADAIHAAVEGPVSSFWPASALQLHPDVTVFVDAESAARLTMREYYRRARDNERRGLGGE